MDINYRIYEVIKLIHILAEKKGKKRAAFCLYDRKQFNAEMWYTKRMCL